MFIQCARAQPNMTANTSNAIFMIWFSVRSHYLECIGACQNYYIGLLYRLMSLFIVKFGFNITYCFGWKHACFACRALWTLDWCERHFADFDTLYRVETWILRFRYEFIVFSKWYLREKHSVILMRCYLNQLSYNPKVDQLLIYIVVTANLGQEGSQLRSVKESCLIYMSVLFNKRLKLRLFI